MVGVAQALAIVMDLILLPHLLHPLVTALAAVAFGVMEFVLMANAALR